MVLLAMNIVAVVTYLIELQLQFQPSWLLVVEWIATIMFTIDYSVNVSNIYEEFVS
jgi:hypothetical protein